MGETRTLLIVGLVLLCVAFVFQLIGLSVPYWMHSKVEVGTSSSELNYGLWTFCTKISTPQVTQDECKRIENEEDWLKAVQAMEILAFLVFLAAVIVLILKLFVLKDNDILLKVAMALCFAGGLFALIGVIVFAAEVDTDNTDLKYHFGFAFTIIGSLLGIGAGVVLVVDMVKG